MLKSKNKSKERAEKVVKSCKNVVPNDRFGLPRVINLATLVYLAHNPKIRLQTKFSRFQCKDQVEAGDFGPLTGPSHESVIFDKMCLICDKILFLFFILNFFFITNDMHFIIKKNRHFTKNHERTEVFSQVERMTEVFSHLHLSCKVSTF